MRLSLSKLGMTLGLAAALGLTACGSDGSGDGNTDGGHTQQNANVSCNGQHLCIVQGTLVEDVTFTADNEYLLRGGVFVGRPMGADGVVGDETSVLTIEPGTRIYGETSGLSFLAVNPGSQILAEGTADAPIVFTSAKNEGERARGDWGGLVLNGRAPINACAEADGAACVAFGEGGTGWYGGDDPEDDSGVLRYVRVEFAGRILSPDNEMNGIAFQGVGSGTTIDYIQVHKNKDDGVEFFGGTAQAKHLLITGQADDALDWTDGWQGKAQFVVLQHDGAGDQGIEADNNGEENAATPRSYPTLANLTILGRPGGDADSDIGMLLREGTAALIDGAVVLGFDDACIDVDQTETFDVADAGDLVVQNSIVSCATPFDNGEQAEFDVEAWFTDPAFGNEVVDFADVETLFVNAFDTGSPDFTPASGSPVTEMSISVTDPFFEQVDFIGGVGPGDDWTAGWTTFAQG